MIPHFPGKIRAPPPTTDSGRHTGALRAPWGASLDGQFPLDKTHTRARVRACVCVGASVRGRRRLRRLWADGRRAPGRRCSGAPCGRLGAPRPRGCSLGLSKGALQALCCAQGARWALLGRSSGARGALVGAPLGRSSGARAGRLLGRSSGARQALSGARAGRSSSAHQARAGRSFWALLGRSSGAHWALRAIILELHGHSMLRQS